jgi:predicted DNA-binding transcriptional regulator YafY
MQERGWPIESDEGLRKGRRYWIDRSRTTHAVKVTIQEATALFLAARLLSRTIDTSNPIVFSALHKLADPLEVTAPLVAQYIRKAARAVRQHPGDETATTVFQKLAQGWSESRKVRIMYQSIHSTTMMERVVSPYYLEAVEAEQAFYVLGHDSKSDSIRIFKVDRISEAELLPNRFRIPADFDPLEQLQSAWGIMWASDGKQPDHVVLQFAPEIVREIKERYWHPTQRMVDLADGSLRFEVTVGHASELRRWIRRWGLHNVEVIAPQSLREELMAEMRAALKHWAG